MAATAQGPKNTPESVVAQTLEAIEAGRLEVLADGRTRQVRAALSGDLASLYGFGPSVVAG